MDKLDGNSTARDIKKIKEKGYQLRDYKQNHVAC